MIGLDDGLKKICIAAIKFTAAKLYVDFRI